MADGTTNESDNKTDNGNFRRLSTNQASNTISLDLSGTERNVSGHRKRWVKLPFLIVLLTLFALSAVYWRKTSEVFEILLQFVADYPVPGTLIIFAIYCLLPVLCVPVYVVAIGAGYVYFDLFGNVGLVVICGLTFVGTSIGAVFAFLTSRYLLKECAHRLAERHTKFRILQALAEQDGIKLVVVCRMAPIVPFVLVNFMLGSMPTIKTKAFIIGNFSLIIRSISFPLFGSTISKISETANKSQSIYSEPFSFIMMILGTIILMVSSVYFTRKGKQEFNRMQEELQLQVTEHAVVNGVPAVELQEEVDIAATV